MPRPTLRKFLPQLAALALILPFLTGCGGSDSRTPEDVAREVVDTLKSDDIDEYLELCIDKKQMLAITQAAIESAGASGADPQKYEEMKEKIDTVYQELDAKRRRDFARMVKEIDWPKVGIESIEVESRKLRGIEDSRARVALDNGKTLVIDDVFLTKSGWRIADDLPLSLK